MIYFYKSKKNYAKLHAMFYWELMNCRRRHRKKNTCKVKYNVFPGRNGGWNREGYAGSCYYKYITAKCGQWGGKTLMETNSETWQGVGKGVRKQKDGDGWKHMEVLS